MKRKVGLVIVAAFLCLFTSAMGYSNTPGKTVSSDNSSTANGCEVDVAEEAPVDCELKDIDWY